MNNLEILMDFVILLVQTNLILLMEVNLFVFTYPRVSRSLAIIVLTPEQLNKIKFIKNTSNDKTLVSDYTHTSLNHFENSSVIIIIFLMKRN